jgi:sugar/nucleoside kinase (ribokinase family)
MKSINTLLVLKSTMGAKVLVAGSIGLDNVKTPFGEVKNEIGGSGIFASLACSIFSKTALMGIIGNDFPLEKLKILEEKKIDLSAIQNSSKPNMRWVAHYDFDVNVAHTDSFASNSLDDLSGVVPQNLKNIKYAFLGNFSPSKQKSILNSFEKKPLLTVSDTMNYYISSEKNSVLDMVKCADIALMNDAEARQLFNTPNLVVAAKEIIKLDSKYAIIKKGEHGCVLFSEKNYFSCPGYPLENVKDPTGCGDSFAGSLIGYLASTEDFSEKNMRKAIVVASAVASFNAESFSFYKLAQISKKDVMNRVKEFKEFSKF